MKWDQGPLGIKLSTGPLQLTQIPQLSISPTPTYHFISEPNFVLCYYEWEITRTVRDKAIILVTTVTIIKIDMAHSLEFMLYTFTTFFRITLHQLDSFGSWYVMTQGR
jgi:hypothetical protein